MDEFKEKEGVQMAKFFNKIYEHAYKRWNKKFGHLDRLKVSRTIELSTGKVFNRANMNYVEKQLGRFVMEEHFEKEKTLAERKEMLTFSDFLPRSWFKSLGLTQQVASSLYEIISQVSASIYFQFLVS
ncbi:MAG: hypothetical protein Q9M40_10915 [Sulfurimonas sp.]|nr:hypothetical protein [Sulfurimonas sp.]